MAMPPPRRGIGTMSAMPEPADSLRRQARDARAEKRFEEARSHLLEAVALLRLETDLAADLAQALRELGEVERRFPPDAARRYYEEAVSILRELNEPLGLAHTLRHLGDVFYETGDAVHAEPCFYEALAIYRSHKTPQLELANAIRSLAVLKSAAGESEEACRLWTEARDLYELTGVQAGVAESNARLAILAKRDEH
jgi:tetratricopeptide (TPR) repeat protein